MVEAKGPISPIKEDPTDPGKWRKDFAFRARHSWSPEQLTDWLAFLAGHLRIHGTTVYEWRSLRDSVSQWRVAWVIGSLVGVFLGSSALVSMSLLQRGATGPSVGVAIVVAALGISGGILAAGFRKGPEPSYREVWGSLYTPSVARLAGRSIVVALFFFNMGVLVYGLDREIQEGILSGVILGVAGGALGGISVASLQWSRPAFRIDRAPSPRRDMREHFARFVRNILLGSLFGGIYGVACNQLFQLFFGLDGATIAATSAGVAGGCVIGLAVPNPWLGYLIGHVWQSTLRRLPWRLADMLDDAYRMGLLRQVGVSFEFRHQKLLGYFSGEIPRSSHPKH